MGAWWQEAHWRFSFQARLSLARKARPRSMVPLTSGAGSAAKMPPGSRSRATVAVRRGMAYLLEGRPGPVRARDFGADGLVYPMVRPPPRTCLSSLPSSDGKRPRPSLGSIGRHLLVDG